VDLIRDFVTEQVKSGAAAEVVVSLISMSDTATVEIHTQPLDASLITKLEQIQRRAPRSHGNYIPALDKALEVMTADAPNRERMLLLLFSDGAPSDHSTMQCEHGVPIFELDRKQDPQMGHRSTGQAWACRAKLQQRTKTECLERIRRLGSLFGRERVIIRTLAFGPPKEDFQLLDELASALPRGEFTKLGLNARNLRTAFSSLSSSMTSLRTEGGGRALTRRSDKVVDKTQKVDTQASMVTGADGWFVYSFEHFGGKFEFNASDKALRRTLLKAPATGLAFFQQPFAEGAERFVYRCTEVVVPTEQRRLWYDTVTEKERVKALRVGLRLVAKEAKDVENLLHGRTFHETFVRVQHDAAVLARYFNRSMPPSIARLEWNVSFLLTNLYLCLDATYKDGEAWVLVEPELDGKFTKWNNNAGAVLHQATSSSSSTAFGTLLEEEEDEDEAIDIDDVPQAFSHFSYEHSAGRQLVCDLQGVWNSEDGFVLTDPVVHYVNPSGRKHQNGATDKGLQGVRKFFQTHRCGPLCRRIGLQVRTENDLIISPAVSPVRHSSGAPSSCGPCHTASASPQTLEQHKSESRYFKQ